MGSPICALGKLYFANEDGDIIVVRDGRDYEELTRNEMKGVITPGSAAIRSRLSTG